MNTPKKAVHFANDKVSTFVKTDKDIEQELLSISSALTSIFQTRVREGLLDALNNYKGAENIPDLTLGFKDDIIVRVQDVLSDKRFYNKYVVDVICNETFVSEFLMDIFANQYSSVGEFVLNKLSSILHTGQLNMSVVVLLKLLNPSLNKSCSNVCGELSDEFHPLSTKVCSDIVMTVMSIFPENVKEQKIKFLKCFDKHFYMAFKCSLIGASYVGAGRKIHHGGYNKNKKYVVRQDKSGESYILVNRKRVYI